MDINVIRDHNEILYQNLIKNGLNKPLNIIGLKPIELQEILNIDHSESIWLQEWALKAREIHLQPGSLLDDRLSTGCEDINTILRGGLPTGRIHEVFGCSGSGKTQFCLQLLLMVQLPKRNGGFNKSAVYLSTEQPFPAVRFHQLAEEAPSRFNVCNIPFEDKVFVESCPDLAQLDIALHIRLPYLMNKVQVGLIILDSIAGVFRSEHQTANFRDRSLDFSRITGQLRKLAKKHNAVVLCINQVRDVMENDEIEPCLGLSWYNLIVQRFSISRTHPLSATREFTVVKSYELEKQHAQFTIHADGLH